MSYIDVTGKTEDEALRKGLEQLGMDRDDVSVSILERAKTGFLGIGATPAPSSVSPMVQMKRTLPPPPR